jgi:signal transduction histidine kinase
MSQRLLNEMFQHLGSLPTPRSPLELRTYREQQMLVVHQSLAMGLINILNGFLAVSLFANTTPHWILVLWYAPLLAFGLLQIHVWQRLRNRRAPSQVSGRFIRRIEATSIATAALWGVATIILPSNSQIGPMLTLVVIQCGMVTGVAALLSTLPRVVLRFSGVCVGMMVTGLLWHGQPEGLFIIIPGVAYMATMYAASMVGHRQMVRLHRAQIATEQARTDLNDAIESINDGFAIIDPSGQVTLTNSRYRDWFGADTTSAMDENDDPVIMPDGSWVISRTRPMSNGGKVCVHNDVTVLKRRERELIEARKEAELADETKSRFMNTMSHELRTPLNVIVGFSKMMSETSERTLSEDEYAEYAAHINSSAEQLLRLINDIIDYSRSGLDDFGFDTEVIPVRELIETGVRRACRATGDPEDLSFDILVSEALKAVNVDERAMLRILEALICNAIKFRGRTPEVAIRAGLTADGRPFITVRDFGIGMKPADVERAFEAFFQASNQIGRDYNGAGLGLTLARQLARFHGGDIILKSRVNAGTAVTLLLPGSVLADPEGQVDRAPPDLLDLAG